jgi:CheY-like chemotaxis protein
LWRNPTQKGTIVATVTEQRCVPDADSSNLPSAGSCRGLRVLLAEADAGNAEFMTLLLEADGHQVQVVADGPSTVWLGQADPPDVLLLEIRLPGMDGWEVAERLQQRPAEKKPSCIAITGCGTEADRLRSAAAGIDLHLVKPADTRYLRRILRRFQEVLGLAVDRQETKRIIQSDSRF